LIVAPLEAIKDMGVSYRSVRKVLRAPDNRSNLAGFDFSAA
jgi:hypothetical protein